MRVLSIDPGISGALAVISGKPGAVKVEAVHDLPTYSEKTSSGKTRRYIDPVALAALIETIGPVDRVVIERLVAPPGISGLAAYSLGATAATIATVLRLAGTNFKLVSSVVWKKAIDCPADKEAARQMASRIFKDDKFWPRRKDHNRAESCLIGVWAVMSA